MRVAVVGAGLAGLTAARTLAAAGLTPLVVEARERPGGRVLDQPLADGVAIELGGAWTGPSKYALGELATELGIGTYRTHHRGKDLFALGGEAKRFGGSIPPIPLPALADLGRSRSKLDRLAAAVPAHGPWRAEHAADLDGQTLGGWMAENMRNEKARAALSLAARSLFAAEPDQVNLLQALTLIRSVGSFQALVADEGGLLQDRFLGGAGRLVAALAGRLGDAVRYGLPALSVRQQLSGVEVTVAGSDGATVLRARRAVVAVPPAAAAAIDFDPPLYNGVREALAAFRPGRVAKVAVLYDEPFWRVDGLSGRSAGDTGYLSSTLDTSPPDRSRGVLTGFVVGERTDGFARLSAAARKGVVLRELTALFGPKAGEPAGFWVKDWNADPWSGGGFFGLAPGAGVTGPIRTLAEPFGAVHWAGAETVWESYGGMDGAVRSGLRAARRIRDELDGS